MTLLNSLSLASILGLVSMGLAIIFGIRGVINLAHGELFVLGAYVTVWVNSAGMSIWIGVIAAPFVVAAIGWVIELTVVSRLYSRPLDTLVATFGLSIVIREAIKLGFGKGNQNVPLPMSGQISVLGSAYPQYRIFLMFCSAIILGVVAFISLRTDVGVKVRAVIQNRSMAEAMGINGRRIDQSVFMLGSALAGLAGALMAPLVTLNPTIGPTFLARSFLVVIVGGAGSVLSAIGGAAFIGVAEGFISSIILPIYAQMVLFALAIVVLCLRPQGLFRRATRN
jgi:urea ABC transporter permease protein UrtB